MIVLGLILWVSIALVEWVIRVWYYQDGFEGGVGFLKPIEIAASWGAIQRGDPNCFLAIACDKNAIQNRELYLIDYESFMETYEKVTELPIFN